VTIQSTQPSGPPLTTRCDMVTSSDSRGMGIPLAVNIKHNHGKIEGITFAYSMHEGDLAFRGTLNDDRRSDGGSHTRPDKPDPDNIFRCRYTTEHSPRNICHIWAGRRRTRKPGMGARSAGTSVGALPLRSSRRHPRMIFTILEFCHLRRPSVSSLCRSGDEKRVGHDR
jgi:hypothetical protein